jgi:predicted SAM-dependent methyltransferase
MVRRANIGCGSVPVVGWQNFDVEPLSRIVERWDIRHPLHSLWGPYDYAVANHVLCALDHHELPVALRNIRLVLREGGVLRVMVPDFESAIHAWNDGRRDWFPQGDQVESIDARFCTYVSWFGTQRSVFTLPYLREVLTAGGFQEHRVAAFKFSTSGFDGITDLDDREGESLFVEAVA